MQVYMVDKQYGLKSPVDVARDGLSWAGSKAWEYVASHALETLYNFAIKFLSVMPFIAVVCLMMYTLFAMVHKSAGAFMGYLTFIYGILVAVVV